MEFKITCLHPLREMLNKWGILACVSEDERNRILNLPHSETPKAIKRLEKEIDRLRFPRKKKTKWQYSWYNPNRAKPVAGLGDEEQAAIDD